MFDSHALEQPPGGATAEVLYSTLREAIVKGGPRPGERLADGQLARQFGARRTPVREAVPRLEVEKFAERLGRRGMVVRPTTEHEVLEVYTVRGVFDGLATREFVRATQLAATRSRLVSLIPACRPTHSPLAKSEASR